MSTGRGVGKPAGHRPEPVGEAPAEIGHRQKHAS
jgi:hypothetical protein